MEILTSSPFADGVVIDFKLSPEPSGFAAHDVIDLRIPMSGAVEDLDANLSFFKLIAPPRQAFFDDKTEKAGHPFGT